MALKVMVIEPDVHRFQSMREELSAGYMVLSCSRGSRALDLFRLFQPHALIINYQTPDLDIEDFINGIQQIPGGFWVPVWFTQCGPAAIGNPHFLSLHPTLFLEESLRPALIRAKLDFHFKKQKV